MQLTAVFQREGDWILGWVEEIPGVNTKGKTMREAKRNLKEALMLVIEMNKERSEKNRPRGKTVRAKIRI